MGLDLFSDKYGLIMGFRTKPVSVAALQFPLSSGEMTPFLGVLIDGLYDLFQLVKTHVISKGQKINTHSTTRTCHQGGASDLYLPSPSRERISDGSFWSFERYFKSQPTCLI